MNREIIVLNKAVDDAVQLMTRYKALMAKVFDMLGYVDITFSENPVKIMGVSEITGQSWELPLWEQKGIKINFYRYPELEEFYEEHKNGNLS